MNIAEREAGQQPASFVDFYGVTRAAIASVATGTDTPLWHLTDRGVRSSHPVEMKPGLDGPDSYGWVEIDPREGAIDFLLYKAGVVKGHRQCISVSAPEDPTDHDRIPLATTIGWGVLNWRAQTETPPEEVQALYDTLCYYQPEQPLDSMIGPVVVHFGSALAQTLWPDKADSF